MPADQQPSIAILTGSVKAKEKRQVRSSWACMCLHHISRASITQAVASAQMSQNVQSAQSAGVQHSILGNFLLWVFDHVHQGVILCWDISTAQWCLADSWRAYSGFFCGVRHGTSVHLPMPQPTSVLSAADPCRPGLGRC